MSETKGGYFFMGEQTIHLPDVKGMSLSALLDQLEWCSYRCEAGPLEHNVAYIELKRRAVADGLNEQATLIAAELYENALRYVDGEIGFDEFKQLIARAVGHEEGEP